METSQYLHIFIDFKSIFFLRHSNLFVCYLLLILSKLQDEKMVMVACGWRHTISVSFAGALYTYGWSKYGQLGHGDFEDHLAPHKLEALSGSVVSQVRSFILILDSNCLVNTILVYLIYMSFFCWIYINTGVWCWNGY